jgi:hypothetical protein
MFIYCTIFKDTKPIANRCSNGDDYNFVISGVASLAYGLVSGIWIFFVDIAITFGFCFGYLLLLIVAAYCIIWASIIISIIGLNYLLRIIYIC